MKIEDHIRRQNRFMPNLLGLSELNIEIAEAINKRKDSEACLKPGLLHRTSVEHGPLSIPKSFRRFGILGVKNDVQHELDDLRSDLGRPDTTKIETIIGRRKAARIRWRRFITSTL